MSSCCAVYGPWSNRQSPPQSLFRPSPLQYHRKQCCLAGNGSAVAQSLLQSCLISLPVSVFSRTAVISSSFFFFFFFKVGFQSNFFARTWWISQRRATAFPAHTSSDRAPREISSSMMRSTDEGPWLSSTHNGESRTYLRVGCRSTVQSSYFAGALNSIACHPYQLTCVSAVQQCKHAQTRGQ